MANMDSLGDRMKGYENISRIYLTRRMPVIIRIDGKAFHTFTRGFKRPYDTILMRTMQETAKHLCEAVGGCKLAYTQSDEISLLLTDYDTLGTQPWFGNNLQKLVSVTASMATMAFNNIFRKHVQLALFDATALGGNDSQELRDEIERVYYPKFGIAMFDARAFVLPREEVCNYFIWRQQDATRNSIESAGRAHFSHGELLRVNCNAIQEMLHEQRGVNWNDYPADFKRGSCVVKRSTENSGCITRPAWQIDYEIPVFTARRDYIENLVLPDGVSQGAGNAEEI